MTTNSLKTKLDHTTDAAKETAHAALDLARDAAGTVRDEAVSLASTAAATARDAATQRVDSARETLADSGERLAQTLQDSADDSSGLGKRAMSGAANGLLSAADTLRANSLEDLIQTARDFAHRRPGAFAAGAAVAGFMLARFLRSSAEGRSTRERAMEDTERVYRDAARRSVDRLGRGDGPNA